MRLLGTTILTVLAAGVCSSQELSPQVLQKVKAATVFVDARDGTGSGVLFKKAGTTGWILTCQHVVEGKKSVNLVFWPGTPREKTVPAKVTAADAYWDLACCEVRDCKDLPDPLPLELRTDARKDSTAYVAGFPFGDRLAFGSKRPEITITLAKVSAILKDEEARTRLVIIKGEVNGGNSGGPVIDAAGKVVGITVAKLVGTQVAFAIPGETVRGFLLGSALNIQFIRKDSSTTNTKYEVSVQLADPLGVIRSAGIAYGRILRAEDLVEPRDNGSWRKASPSFKEMVLRIDEKTGTASGTVEMNRTPADPAEEEVFYQVYWVQGDGTKVWSEPASVKVSFQPMPADQKGGRRPYLPSSMELPPDPIRDLPKLSPSAELDLKAVVSDVAILKGGTQLVALDLGRGKLLRIAPGSMSVEASLDVGDNAAAFALSPDGSRLLVVSRVATRSELDDRKILNECRVQVVDPASWTVTGGFTMPVDPMDAVLTDDGVLCVSGDSGICFVDIADPAFQEKLPSTGTDAFLRFHPDQARLYLGEAGNVFRHLCLPPMIAIDGKRLLHTSRFGGEFPLGGDFEISPDGKQLVTMYGGVVHLSHAPVLNMLPEKTIVPWTAFAFASKSAFGASADGTLRMYAAGSFEIAKSWRLDRRLYHLVASADGRTLYAMACEIPEKETAAELAERLRKRKRPHGSLVAIPVPR